MSKKYVITIQATLKIVYHLLSSHFPKVLCSYWKENITYPISPAAQATTPSVWSSSPAMWSMKDRINSTLGCTSITSAIKERESLMKLSHPWQDYTPHFKISKYTIPPGGWFQVAALVTHGHTELFSEIKMSFFTSIQEADSPFVTSRNKREGTNGAFPLSLWYQRGKGRIFPRSVTETSGARGNLISQSFNSITLGVWMCSQLPLRAGVDADQHQSLAGSHPLQCSWKGRPGSR